VPANVFRARQFPQRGYDVVAALAQFESKRQKRSDVAETLADLPGVKNFHNDGSGLVEYQYSTFRSEIETFLLVGASGMPLNLFIMNKIKLSSRGRRGVRCPRQFCAVIQSSFAPRAFAR
jgi:hypothetical protein